MAQYITVEVMSGAYDISCPDAECEKKGTLLISEMEELVGKELMDKHRNYRLNTGKLFCANIDLPSM
jgi:E3 ubiquitin-protein ligase RNF144